MKALLAATPKAGRLLAPLCFMLGIDAALLRPVLCTVAVPPAPADGDVGCAGDAEGTVASGTTAASTVPARDADAAAAGVDGDLGRENFSRG